MNPRTFLSFSLFILLNMSHSAFADLVINGPNPNHRIHLLNQHRVYLDVSTVDEMNAASEADYHLEIQQTIDAGLIPFGTAFSWVFPEFIGAQKLTPPGNTLPGVQEAVPFCIPDFDTDEYLQLSETRNQEWSTLSREFPEIMFWLVGFEPRLKYYSCSSGEELGLEEMSKFAVDTLRGVKAAVELHNQNAVIVSHFLGRNHLPITLQGESIQPRKIFFSLFKAMRDAGGRIRDYLDVPSIVFDLNILRNRFPEGPRAGWQAKWIEDFPVLTPDIISNTGYYDHWFVMRSPGDTSIPATIPVETDPIDPGNISINHFFDPDPGDPEGRLTHAVAVSESTCGGPTPPQPCEDIVPDDGDFQTSPDENESDYWTAVLDFRADQRTVSKMNWRPHGGVMVRVWDTYWSGPDQTRFGAIIYDGMLSSVECTRTDQLPGCMGLQFTGNRIGDNSVGLRWVPHFETPVDPWDNPTVEYRIQLHERRILGELEWKAELWQANTLLFESEWITAAEVLEHDIEIPALNTSKVLFGIALGTQGGLVGMRVATSYMTY